MRSIKASQLLGAAACIVSLAFASCSGSRSISVLPPANSQLRTIPIRAIAKTNAASVYATATLGDNPVGYWRLGDTGTTTALDSSAKGINGTYAGVGTALTQGTPGLLSTDLGLSATNSGTKYGYVGIPRNPIYESANKLSIEAWVKPNSLATYITMAGYGDNGGTLFRGYDLRYSLAAAAFGFRIEIAGSTITVFATGGPGYHPSAGHVYHVVGTYNGSAVKLYVNGALAKTRSIRETLPTTRLRRMPADYFFRTARSRIR